MGTATIQGRLLFSVSSVCSYYSQAATIWGVASIRINTVNYIDTYVTLHENTKHNVLTIIFELS